MNLLGRAKGAYYLNELRYIFSWLLIIVAIGIGCYMCLVTRKKLEKQRLKLEAKYAKFIGYSYILAGLLAIIIYKV